MRSESTNNLPSADCESYDLFISYNSRDRETVQRVKKSLLDRGVKTFLDIDNLTAGQMWIDELPSAIESVQAVAIFYGKHGLGPWQKREMMIALERQSKERNRNFPVIPIILPGADLTHAPAFLLTNTCIDLSNGVDDTVAINAFAKVISGTASTSPKQLQPYLSICPYRGLLAFREEDALFFFGREEASKQLLEKISTHKLVAVVGPSGGGKSSIIQAGLLPLLRHRSLPNSPWKTTVFTPGKNPFLNLAAALIPLWMTQISEKERSDLIRNLRASLAGSERSLEEIVKNMRSKEADTTPLLLIVDQFEEIFTQAQEKDRRPFINSLINVTMASPTTKVLIAFRADFYSHIIETSRELSDALQQGIINVGSLNRGELRDAIVEPAKKVGLEFEPGLVNRLLDHYTNQPGNLPLLEYALSELWNRRQGIFLQNEKYDEIGGPDGIISMRADLEIKKLPIAQQEMALRAFTRLVRVATTAEKDTDTRHRVNLNELDGGYQSVLLPFIEARLLVMSRDEATNEKVIEAAHEALIRNWKRLREELDKRRDFLLWRQLLNIKLNEWESADHDTRLLLNGSLLKEAKEKLKKEKPYLNGLERKFITNSISFAEKVRHGRNDNTPIGQSKSLANKLRAWALFLIVVIAALPLIRLALQHWEDRPILQVKRILSTSPQLVKSTVAGQASAIVVKRWLLTLLLTGNRSEALQATCVISDIGLRSDILYDAILQINEVGKTAGANQYTNNALEFALEIEKICIGMLRSDETPIPVKSKSIDFAFEAVHKQTSYLNLQATLRTMKLLAETSSSDETRKIADKTLDAASKVTTLESQLQELQYGFKELAQSTGRAELMAVAHKIDDAQLQSLAFVNLARSMAIAGKVNDSQNALYEARGVAMQLISDADRSKTLAAVAIGLAEIRLYRQARETADLCAFSEHKLSAYTAIVQEHNIERDIGLAVLFEQIEKTEK